MQTVIVNNPAIEYFLDRFRDENSGTYECNQCVETMSIFLAGEVSRYLSTRAVIVKTPLGRKVCPVISGDIVPIPVLRAGDSMFSEFQRILPQSKYRESASAEISPSIWNFGDYQWLRCYFGECI